MVRDDKDNKWVKGAFGILLVLNVILVLHTLWKCRNLWLSSTRHKRLYLLYLCIITYSLCMMHAVRIVWYLDIAVHYPLYVYYILEVLPVLPLLGVYSTVSCLWYCCRRLELYFMFRTVRGCNIRTLLSVRFFFFLLNVCAYLGFLVLEIVFAKTHRLYEYASSRENTFFVSAILQVALCEVLVTGLIALKVINSLLQEKGRKVRCTQICIVQYTAVVACAFRVIVDLLQYPLTSYFDRFQRHPAYGVYIFCFFAGLEMFPVVVLLLIIEVQQQEAQSKINTQLQSTMEEDVFLASYTAVPLDNQRFVDPV